MTKKQQKYIDLFGKKYNLEYSHCVNVYKRLYIFYHNYYIYDYKDIVFDIDTDQPLYMIENYYSFLINNKDDNVFKGIYYKTYLKILDIVTDF